MKSRVKTIPRGKRKTGAKAAVGRKGLKLRKAAKRSQAAAAKSDPLDSWIVPAAQGLGLKLEKSWMPAIRGNLRVTLDQAAMVAEFPLPDDAEPAPVFRA